MQQDACPTGALDSCSGAINRDRAVGHWRSKAAAATRCNAHMHRPARLSAQPWYYCVGELKSSAQQANLARDLSMSVVDVGQIQTAANTVPIGDVLCEPQIEESC
eukprot:SAG11_NODE_1233_length_5450_cov_5.983368_4_plen_105_part_00